MYELLRTVHAKRKIYDGLITGADVVINGINSSKTYDIYLDFSTTATAGLNALLYLDGSNSDTYSTCFVGTQAGGAGAQGILLVDNAGSSSSRSRGTLWAQVQGRSIWYGHNVSNNWTIVGAIVLKDYSSFTVTTGGIACEAQLKIFEREE
jgi:hypothetical protein